MKHDKQTRWPRRTGMNDPPCNDQYVTDYIRRPRRPLIGVVVIGVVILVGLVALSTTSGHARLPVKKVVANSGLAVSQTNPAGPRLTWTPAGSTIQTSQDPRYPGTTFLKVTLPGAANADTIPKVLPNNVATARLGTYHAATGISVVVVSGVTTMPSLPVDPQYFVTSTIAVNGLSASLSVPRSGWGPYRIDWIDNGKYVSVLCDHGDTSAGPTGISVSDLEKVAAGVTVS